MIGMFQRPQRSFSRGPDEESLGLLYEKAGLDIDEISKINKGLRLGQLKRLRAREKRPVSDESDARTLKWLRHGIEERRRIAEGLATVSSAAPGQTSRVYLDTPFMIQANSPDRLIDTKPEAWNSMAHFRADYFDDISRNTIGPLTG